MASRLVALSRLGRVSVGRSSHWKNQFTGIDGQTLRNPLCCSQTPLLRFKSAPATNPQSVEPETVPEKDGVKELINDATASGGDGVIAGVRDVNTDSNAAGIHTDLSFSDPVVSYQSKTTLEVLRAALVLKLCQFDFLVKYNKQILSVSRKLLGKRLFEGIMKATFYGHFVAGENQPSIQPLVNRLNQYGVGAILDYSVEEDISHSKAVDAEMDSCISGAEEDVLGNDKDRHLRQFQAYPEFGDRREGVSSARTYFYTDERKCDDNLEILKECVRVAGATSKDGFAAVKLTALGRPQILLNLSEVITRTRDMYMRMTGYEGTSMEDLIMCRLSREQFTSELETLGITTRDECGEWFTWIDTDKDGSIDLLDWECLVQPDLKLSKILKAPKLEGDKLEMLQFNLTEEEEQQMKRMLQRINELAKCARDQGVRLMVDAEQTYFQPAISRLTMEMMRKFNRTKPIIFNTYQCYLKQAYNCVTVDMELARRENFHFGAKLVRGAYMDQERKRAVDIGYEDPINPSYEATNESYTRCLNMVLDRIHTEGQINIMVASHNQDTVRHAVQRMHELNIGAKDRLVYFGQLLGMCDQVSFPLGEMGYAVYKYVPYGPVDDVLPYLSRRAEENSGMLKGVKQERQLLWQELRRRVSGGEIFHKP